MNNQAIPPDDITDHEPDENCPCKPIWTEFEGNTYLFHKPFDRRDIWMDVEIHLGLRCKEHNQYVVADLSAFHIHTEPPEKYYEYLPHPL